MAIYLGNTPIKPSGISKVFVGPHQVYQSRPAHTDYLYFTSPSTGYIAYETFGTVNVDIQTSTDMRTWEAWDGTQKTISSNEKLYVKNTTNNLCVDTDNYVRFTTASGITLMGGNIMSMINYSDLTNYCFFGLFSDCTYLNTLDDFIMPATTLAEACYQSMFYGCTALTSTPVLPATTLVNNCYYYMFYNCSILTVNQNTGEGVALLTCPDTTGITTPVENMFSGTYGSFTKTPTTGNVYYRPECYLYFTSSSSATLGYTKSGSVSCNIQTSSDKTNWTDWNGSAITLSENKLYVRNTTNTLSIDFSNSFKFTTPSGAVKAGGNCMSMVNHAALSNDCFLYLFTGCSGLDLLSDFILSNKTLKPWCYREMFANCTSLTTAPKLPATTIPTYAYYRMFYQCTSLMTPSIIAATNVNAYYACCQMFSGCSNLLVNQGSGGVSFFKCPSALPEGAVTNMFTSTGGTFTGTPTAGNTYYYVEPYLYFTGTGTIKYTINGTVSCNIQTSSDKINWTDWDGTAITLTANKLYVRNTLSTLSTSNSDRVTFATTGSVLAGGNCNSMVNHSALSDYCFYGLFANCSTLDLTNDFSLPATTLATYCYGSMFMRCTSLTNPPSVLPATTLAERCYGQMFWGCTSLTKAPNIPATTLATNSCGAMFGNCSSLNVSENSGGTAFFTCPDMTGVTSPVVMMFDGTGGSFTEDPTTNNTYYYNQPATLTNNESLKNYIQSNNITSCSICKHSEVPEGTTDVTSAITGLSNGYAGVLNSALYISGLDDSMVIAAPDMSSLFGSANLLTSLSVSNLDTRNVTNMEGMFVSLPYVTTLDVSNFNTSNVTNMSSMFNMDVRLQTIIGLENFDTSKVIYFSMMFKGCAALTTLDLTSFSSDNCQYIFSMFEGCTNLANIYVEESWYPTHTGSVQSGSGKDVFKDCPALPGYSSTATNSYAYCRLVTETENPGYFTKKPEPYLYFTTSTSGTIGYTKNGAVSCNIQTSSNKINWNDWDGSAITLSADKLYVRNTLDTLSLSVSSDYLKFTTTGSVIVGGNCNSMINYAALSNYCFTRLFYECIGLDLASDFTLPATALAQYCYWGMFNRCTSLTTPPTLPATTLAPHCYQSMFYGSTSLTTAPALSATTLVDYCYGSMFGGCSNLKVSENSGSHLIFTCPDTTGISYAVRGMFTSTGGTFTGTPTSENTYYYN